VLDDGAVTRCVAAPPSDHERKRYVWPLARTWGVGAVTVFMEPTITVLEKGAVED
jgi:hypothetical protein